MSDKNLIERKITKTHRRLERLENELRLANYMEAAEKIDKIFNEIYRIAEGSKKEGPREVPFKASGFPELGCLEMEGYSVLIEEIKGGSIKGKYIRK